jgi:CRP-like cAMP-binding protein
MDKKENRLKKKDPLLDLIFDLDLDDLEEADKPKNNKIEDKKQVYSKELIIDVEDQDKLITEDKNFSTSNKIQSNTDSKLLNYSNELDNLSKIKNKNNYNQKTKLGKKLSQEDIKSLEKLVNNIILFLQENDEKNIKDIKDYFFKNSDKINFKKLSEFNTNDEIFKNNVAFLANGFGYYYNPYKNLIVDFFFPYDLIYFPILLEYEKLKINILFREKSTVFLCPKSDFILKKIFYKYILRKYHQNIIRELNLRNLDSYDKLLFFIYFYLENYYKLNLKKEDYYENNQSYQIKLPIKKIANFLGISYEVLIRNLKKIKESNIISKKENKLFINIKEFKNSFSNLEKKLLII